MIGLDKILAALREHRVPHACKWINYQPHREREPQVQALIDGVKWTMFFAPGRRGWLLKVAVAGQREIRTLAAVLDAIAAEGARLDAAEAAAQAELSEQ